jgi:hypothetical protein
VPPLPGGSSTAVSDKLELQCESIVVAAILATPESQANADHRVPNLVSYVSFYNAFVRPFGLLTFSRKFRQIHPAPWNLTGGVHLNDERK